MTTATTTDLLGIVVYHQISDGRQATHAEPGVRCGRFFGFCAEHAVVVEAYRKTVDLAGTNWTPGPDLAEAIWTDDNRAGFYEDTVEAEHNLTARDPKTQRSLSVGDLVLFDADNGPHLYVVESVGFRRLTDDEVIAFAARPGSILDPHDDVEDEPRCCPGDTNPFSGEEASA